jgi:hypothetical protein
VPGDRRRGGSKKNSFPGQTRDNNYVIPCRETVTVTKKSCPANGCPKRQRAHIHTTTPPRSYGPAKWLPLPAPRLPLPGSAQKLQNFLISFADASIPPFPLLPLIPLPKLSARFHSLVYARSLPPQPMLSAPPPLLFPLALSRTRASLMLMSLLLHKLFS